jgi:hypothetical protein
MQEVEDVKVAKFPSSRSSGCSGIPRRSCALVRQDLVEVVLVDLGRGRSSGHVREVCTCKGNLPVRIGGQGEVWSYQARRSPPVTVAGSARNFCSLAARFRGGEGREERGGCEVLIGMVLMAITREKSTGGYYSGDRFQKRRERKKIAGGG